MVKCMSCDTLSPAWHHISAADETEFSSLKGNVNFCMKCKFCKRPGFIDIIKDSNSVYKEEDSGEFKTIVSFECKGIEPVEYTFEDGWNVKALDQNTVFENVNLMSNDWMDYDTKSNMPVSISDLKSKFVRDH
ncbi:hypothetical protein B566_EDAN000988 [Ephemera danica]|nr:hypothetical protein B566_EDAN000988 [Ephemera danica]